MLYLIGLGLNLKGLSKESYEIVKRCKKVYLENYTIDFPYSLAEITEFLGKDIISLNREKVESLEIVDEARKKDVALLIYGSPLSATTHISLLDEAKNSRVKCRVLYAGSIFDAIAETGLQLYKFGKTASLPKWVPEKNFRPESFIEIIKDNQKINAHSLLLIDIDLGFFYAIKQLKEVAKKHKLKLDKILICQKLGTRRSKIFYKNISELEDLGSISKPYCIIIPAKLNSLEKDFLKRFDY